MSRILVTGGSGFIGRALCPTLRAHGFNVSVATRNPRQAEKLHDVQIRPIPNLGSGTDWTGALREADAVVHMAARVHVMKDTAADPEREFHRVNTEATRRLAEDAAMLGVSRFVYVSTIKVNGERTEPDRPFTPFDEPDPRDAYARSKWEAERILWEIAEQSGMEVVVVRPPLVYGPGVKGNFLTLLEKCARGPTLPLGRIDNRRSLIFVGNLIDILVRCLVEPAAAGQTFLVRDGEDLSSPDLIRRVSKALGSPARLLPVPVGLLRLAGAMTGRGAQVGRLLDSLTVDDSHTREVLDWTPPWSVDEAVEATAEWFKERPRR